MPAKKNTPPKTESVKQLKIFLNPREHAVLVLAANMSGKKLGQYMKDTLLKQAKIDAKKMNDILDTI